MLCIVITSFSSASCALCVVKKKKKGDYGAASDGMAQQSHRNHGNIRIFTSQYRSQLPFDIIFHRYLQLVLIDTNVKTEIGMCS